MTDNIVRREVQRRNDPFGIPACFYWTIDEVADWVESIGYGKYKENFRSHFINGRKLLTVDACILPKMGITHFGDILAIESHVKALEGTQRRITSGAQVAPYVDFYPMDNRAEATLMFGGELSEHPSIADPWRGHQRHIAMKTAGPQGLYFTSYAWGTKPPHWAPY